MNKRYLALAVLAVALLFSAAASAQSKLCTRGCAGHAKRAIERAARYHLRIQPPDPSAVDRAARPGPTTWTLRPGDVGDILDDEGVCDEHGGISHMEMLLVPSEVEGVPDDTLHIVVCNDGTTVFVVESGRGLGGDWHVVTRPPAAPLYAEDQSAPADPPVDSPPPDDPPPADPPPSDPPPLPPWWCVVPEWQVECQ